MLRVGMANFGGYHEDFLQQRPYQDENGNTRYPSRFRLHRATGEGVWNLSDLYRRGWTRTAIKRFLGEPDRRIPLRRREDRSECLYDRGRVLSAEATGFMRFRKASEGPRRIIIDCCEVDEYDCYVQNLNPLPGETVDGTCQHCFMAFDFQLASTGRPRKYCSTSCRNRAARKNTKKQSPPMQN